MLKRTVKYIALFFMLSALLICFSSCKNKKDVYGAASDFIKVSHPDKPNTNVFSDESYDGNKSSSDNSEKGKGSKTASSDASTTSSDASKEGSSSSVKGDSQKSGSSSGSSEDTETNLNKNPVEGDQGPIVEF